MPKRIDIQDLNLTAKDLNEMHNTENLSFSEMSRRLGVNYRVISRWIKEHNIERNVPLDKISYSDAKSLIESSDGCILLTPEDKYKNTDSRIEIQCECKNIFTSTLHQIKDRQEIICFKCFRKSKAELKNRQITKLLEESGQTVLGFTSTETQRKAKVICKCEEYYERRVSYFDSQDSKVYCNVCENGYESKYSFNKLKTKIEKESNCQLIDFKRESGKSLIMTLKCKCEETFSTNLGSFYAGQKRCRKCSGKTQWSITKIEDYMKKEEMEFELLNREYVNMSSKMKFKCSCGNIFDSTWNVLYSEKRKKCTVCNKKGSTGERKIIDFLISYNLNFTYEKLITSKKEKRHFYFDFLVEDKILIEYDGEAHFFPINFSGVSDEKNIEYWLSAFERDKKKNLYSTKEDIPLIRIPYWELEDIEKILMSVLTNYKLIEGCREKEDISTYLVSKDWSQYEYQQRDTSKKAEEARKLLKKGMIICTS